MHIGGRIRGGIEAWRFVNGHVAIYVVIYAEKKTQSSFHIFTGMDTLSREAVLFVSFL